MRVKSIKMEEEEEREDEEGLEKGPNIEMMFNRV